MKERQFFTRSKVYQEALSYAKFNSQFLKIGGSGLAAVNYGINHQSFKNREMTQFQYRSEQASNSISTFGGLYGIFWGVGWEAGRVLTNNSNTYKNFKYNYIVPGGRDGLESTPW